MSYCFRKLILPLIWLSLWVITKLISNWFCPTRISRKLNVVRSSEKGFEGRLLCVGIKVCLWFFLENHVCVGVCFFPQSHTFFRRNQKKILHWNQKCFQQRFSNLFFFFFFRTSHVSSRQFVIEISRRSYLISSEEKATKDKITKNNHFHFVYCKRALDLLGREVQGVAKIWQKLFASRALKSFVMLKMCSRAAKSTTSVHHAENRCICSVR